MTYINTTHILIDYFLWSSHTYNRMSAMPYFLAYHYNILLVGCMYDSWENSFDVQQLLYIGYYSMFSCCGPCYCMCLKLVKGACAEFPYS